MVFDLQCFKNQFGVESNELVLQFNFMFSVFSFFYFAGMILNFIFLCWYDHFSVLFLFVFVLNVFVFFFEISFLFLRKMCYLNICTLTESANWECLGKAKNSSHEASSIYRKLYFLWFQNYNYRFFLPLQRNSAI